MEQHIMVLKWAGAHLGRLECRAPLMLCLWVLAGVLSPLHWKRRVLGCMQLAGSTLIVPSCCFLSRSCWRLMQAVLARMSASLGLPMPLGLTCLIWLPEVILPGA